METEENVQFDERLSETVRRFPCLFDKTKREYRDKNITKNAWDKIAEEVGVESGML